MAITCYNVGIFLLLGHICITVGDCSVNTPGVYTFGPECEYMCHCKNGARCNRDTGECPNRCDSNWFGPACQYRDLAEGQYSRQNSLANPPKTAMNARDGVISTCSYTEEASLSAAKPWWRVWFPQNETIRDVYIHTMKDRLVYFPGFEVNVEYVPEREKDVPTYKHTCYHHGDTVPGSVQIHVQCEHVLVGNQVRITLSKVQSQLALCDVRIGAEQSFAAQCRCRFGSTVTSDLTDCFAVGNTEYKYLDIDFGMPIYAYSVKINTISDDKIKDYRIYAATANATSLQLVHADSGKMPKVINAHINTEVQLLRLLTNNTNQMVICELEIYGECPTNKCGYDCSENCYCSSYEDMEQRISGVCTTGCQGRRTGTAGKCKKECDEMKWGTQCQYDCGACRIGTCDVLLGKCTGGYEDGYFSTDDCKSEDSIQTQRIVKIACYVLAGIMVICAIIVVVCIIMYKRRQTLPVITEQGGHNESSIIPTSVSYDELQRNSNVK